jgi:hypothetical protein
MRIGLNLNLPNLLNIIETMIMKMMLIRKIRVQTLDQFKPLTNVAAMILDLTPTTARR